jgi:hypothetical protein
MIGCLNPGNIVVFTRNQNLQRHRLIGTDRLPYGLPVPNTRLTPFQFYVDELYADWGLTSWALIDVTDESQVYTQDNAQIEIRCKTTTVSDPTPRFWITFHSEQLSSIPPCGFYEIRFQFDNGATFTSEVLHLKEYADYELAGLVIEDCEIIETLIRFTLIASDALIGTVVSQTIEVEIEPGIWSTLGTDSGDLDISTSFFDLAPRPANIRRIVTTSLGNTLTAVYTLDYDDLDPCGTSEFLLVSQDLVPSAYTRDLWRLTFTNANDKGEVLYQTGYTQELFLEPGPVFNSPVIDRTVERTVNGNGDEVKRFTRTLENWRWESLDIPDYLIHTLNTLADVDEIYLENVGKDYRYQVYQFTFTARRQSPSMSIGEFQVTTRSEVFSGCAQDYAIQECV